jgi:hypothetical protein
MKIATKWLAENGYPARHLEKTPFKNCHSIQFDGAASISFDSNALIETLETNLQCDIEPTDVVLIDQPGSSIRLNTSCGKTFASEVTVLACHQGIKNLLPVLAPTLVNHADQLVEFGIQSGEPRTKVII